MGGSQSQEDERSQNFSTIGLPPPAPYHHQRPVRSAPLSGGDPSLHPIPEQRSRGRRYFYESSEDSQENDDDERDWVQVPRRVTLSQLPPTPPSQPPKRPPLPREPPNPIRQAQRGGTGTRQSVDIPRSSRMRSSASASHSLRDMEDQEFVDLSRLITSLLTNRSHPDLHGNGTQEQTGIETERRMHRAHISGRSRHRSRHHHSESTPNRPFIFLGGIPKTKCPLCSREFPAPEFEEHLAECSSKPRVQFNVDKLMQDAGECSICLDDMVTGDEIGRLPCLCVYHIKCLREWFKKSQTCPEHPDMKGGVD